MVNKRLSSPEEDLSQATFWLLALHMEIMLVCQKNSGVLYLELLTSANNINQLNNEIVNVSFLHVVVQYLVRPSNVFP